MAPQQNSTLIDNNLIDLPSLTNSPEELIRCSPILPPKMPHKSQQTHNVNQNNKNIQFNVNQEIHEKLKETIKQPKKMQQQQETESKSVQPEKLKQKCQQHKMKHYRNGNNRAGRSRSISLSGISGSTTQGDKEIPIWIDDEPRYVSGITHKTTCNDIIRALIDDEVQHGNYAYCKRTKDGSTASRDYSDYVITESWRGIERNYDGNMAILPIWKAWSRVHNELRLSLKHFKELQEPRKLLKKKNSFSALYRCISKLFKFPRERENALTKALPQSKALKCLLSETKHIPDELLFVILPDTQYIIKESKATTQRQHLQQQRNFTSPLTAHGKLGEAKLFKDKLYRLAETRTSLHKRRAADKRKEKQRRHAENNNCIRRRAEVSDGTSALLRNQLAEKTNKIDELYEREYTLTKRLSNKCRLYQLQNALYTQTQRPLDISIGQVQSSVENYAQQIISTEHELLELKNEIKADISIINNLKRMTLETKNENCKMPVSMENAATTVPSSTVAEQMQFVDNIYEFCDNNASMLV